MAAEQFCQVHFSAQRSEAGRLRLKHRLSMWREDLRSAQKPAETRMNQLLAPRLLEAERPPARAADTHSIAGAAPEADSASLSKPRDVPAISCVIPCRNEAQNLVDLLPLLAQTLARCTHAWEIVLVDDGSTDGSDRVMAAWARQLGFRVLQLSRNFGKEAALTAGLQACSGEVVVMMDADMQHPPALIPSLLDHWRAGADVAYAARTSRRDEGRFKRFGARFFYALLNGGDRFEVPAGAGDFRLMDRRVVDAILSLPERNRFMKGLYAWVGFKAVAVPYVPEARAHGRSRFGPLRLVRLSLAGLTAFTIWPLRAVSVVGFALALAAFVYGATLTMNYLLYGHNISGWTTIVVSLMLFSGIQLISLGIVGEYVGRVFEEVKARPLFVIKRELGRGMTSVRP
jgi:polyisoprenyl-phosphate glycosyltransferase